LYNRDVLLACARNRHALRNFFERNNGVEVPRLVKPRNQAARQSQAAFVRVAESASDARDWAAAAAMLDPVAAYLRIFDGQSGRLSLVLPATTKLQKEMDSIGSTLRTSGTVGTASADVFSQLTATVAKRVSGPTDCSVRVLLLVDIHFLEAALDPILFYAQASDVSIVEERTFRAVRSFLVCSPVVISPHQLVTLNDDQRVTLLREQFTAYTGLSGTFFKGAFAARKPGMAVDIASIMTSSWDALGWWSLYGGSAPELREIGKALAGMSPSCCPVERSFSVQKSIHTLVRNRLAHDKVAKLMFVHTNLSVLEGRDGLGNLPGFLQSVVEEEIMGVFEGDESGEDGGTQEAFSNPVDGE